MRFGERGLWRVEAAFWRGTNQTMGASPAQKCICLLDVTVVVLDQPPYALHEWKFFATLRELCGQQRTTLVRNPK
jgi:hypothetical protein